MKKIKLLNGLLLLPIFATTPIIVTSCSKSNVSIDSKTYTTNMGGVGAYTLSFKNKIVYQPGKKNFSVPVISLSNIKAYDEVGDEVFLPYGAEYLVANYDYIDNTNQLKVGIIPTQSSTTWLKYILRFTFDINVKWKTVSDISLLDSQLPDWESTITNCELNYVCKVTMPDKNIVLPRGESRAEIKFRLFTTIDTTKQKIKIIPHTSIHGLSIVHLAQSLTIGNGYITAVLSISNVNNVDIIEGVTAFDVNCYDLNNELLWSQTINDVKVTSLENKFDIKNHDVAINPSASAIVAAGEKGLDYTFDLYFSKQYPSFNAEMWIETPALSPYTKSIKLVKYEYTNDATFNEGKLSITMNIVAAKLIEIGKTELFILKMKTNQGWDHLSHLTMWCEA